VRGLPGIPAGGDKKSTALPAGLTVGGVVAIGVAVEAGWVGVAVGGTRVAVGVDRMVVGVDTTGVLVDAELPGASTVKVVFAPSPLLPRITTERGPAGAVAESCSGSDSAPFPSVANVQKREPFQYRLTDSEYWNPLPVMVNELPGVAELGVKTSCGPLASAVIGTAMGANANPMSKP